MDPDVDRQIRGKGGQDSFVMGLVSGEVDGGDIAVGCGAIRWVDDRPVSYDRETVEIPAGSHLGDIAC